MIIFLSTPCLSDVTKQALIDNKVKNLLFSFAFKDQLPKWENLIRELNRIKIKPNIMIDSGAFSAWTIGKTVDREKYLDFVKEFIKRNKKYCDNIYVTNLDMIPGSFRRKPTKKEAEESAYRSRKNFLWFLSKGIKTINVFHQHEDYKWLLRMIEECDYIGISPANDLSTKQRFPFLKKCFLLLKDYIFKKKNKNSLLRWYFKTNTF